MQTVVMVATVVAAVTMQALASLVMAMETVMVTEMAMETVVTPPLLAVSDTTGLEGPCPSWPVLQVVSLCWSQSCLLVSLGPPGYLGCDCRAFLKPPDDDLLPWSLCCDLS